MRLNQLSEGLYDDYEGPVSSDDEFTEEAPFGYYAFWGHIWCDSKYNSQDCILYLENTLLSICEYRYLSAFTLEESNIQNRKKFRFIAIAAHEDETLLYMHGSNHDIDYDGCERLRRILQHNLPESNEYQIQIDGVEDRSDD